MVDYVQVGLFGFLLLSLIMLNGCTEPETKNNEQLQTELNTTKENLTTANNKIIELQETNEYLRKEMETARTKEQELQQTYNKLWEDAINCYWANYCLYFPEGCEEHFSWGDTENLKAQDYHLYYSDECDMMIRDWDLYISKKNG